MGKIIALANQKGGVGKTTSCVNLCCALKYAGKKVLLCDLDPQGNATSGMGVNKNALERDIYTVLSGDDDAASAIIETPYGDLLPANRSLAGAAIELVMRENREYILRDALASVRDRYDFILIDCPPSLEMLTLNGLCASDTLLIPVQCEYYALEGLSDLLTTIRMVKKRMNPGLDIEGVLLTMYDSRTNFSAQVAAEIKKYFKTKVYNVVIPRNVRLSEAPSHGKPVLAYDAASRGSKAYSELAREVMNRNRT